MSSWFRFQFTSLTSSCEYRTISVCVGEFVIAGVVVTIIVTILVGVEIVLTVVLGIVAAPGDAADGIVASGATDTVGVAALADACDSYSSGGAAAAAAVVDAVGV